MYNDCTSLIYNTVARLIQMESNGQSVVSFLANEFVSPPPDMARQRMGEAAKQFHLLVTVLLVTFSLPCYAW